ncbi:MAG: hypothetical protein RL385_2540, partial [Pseudomonadota bacterium]
MSTGCASLRGSVVRVSLFVIRQMICLLANALGLPRGCLARLGYPQRLAHHSAE